MKNSLLFLIGLFIISCSNPQNAEEAPVSGKKQIAQHVIVIGVDGMSPNGILNAHTPNIDLLINNGASTMNARAVLPTSSSPNWASMIMGAGPEQHGITSNGWEREEHALPPVSTGIENIFPTIFGVLHEQRPEAEIGTIYHWKGFGRLFEKSAVDYDRHGETEVITTELAVEYIESKKPKLCFIHLDHVDGAGHRYGHGSIEYFKSIALADSLIGQIYRAIEDAGMMENAVIILTSDHGGIGYGHGGETPEEITIPFVLYGNKIKKGNKIKHEIITYDNAATVAFLLGLTPPYAWIGTPVKSAIEGYPEPKSSMIVHTLPAPVIFPPANMYAKAGGLFVDEIPEVKIESPDSTLEIRFTLNGEIPTRESKLYEQPFSIKESVVVLAKTFDQSGEESPVNKAFFRMVKTGEGNGIKYKLYKGSNWGNIPEMENLKPDESGDLYEFALPKAYAEGSPGQFAMALEGEVLIEKEGKYTFYTYSDDGSILYINDKKIVDNGGQHGVIESGGGIDLKPGKHKIKVDYFNHGGGAWLEVWYKGPGVPKQILPANLLFLKQKL